LKKLFRKNFILNQIIDNYIIMNSLLRGMSLLPGLFLTTGSDRLKVLSGKVAKQTTEIENLKNNLLDKNYECDLQASQLAAQKVALGNLRSQLEIKADKLRRQMELVNLARREAQTRANKHQWEIKQLKKKIEEISETLHLKSSYLSNEKAEVGRLTIELSDLRKGKEITFKELCNEKEKSNDLSMKLNAEISKHGHELANMKTCLEMKSLRLLEETQTNGSLRNVIKAKSVKTEEQAKRIVEQRSKIIAHAFEIKDYKSEIATKTQDLEEKSKSIKDLQKDIQKKADLLREQEKTIDENALEVQKKSNILLEQDRQIADNAILIQTITKEQEELQENYENETQKLKDLQEESQKQTQKMKALQEYSNLSTKKIYNLERNIDIKTRAINELNSSIKTRNNMIRELENIIEDHVKNIQEQAASIDTRSEEIKALKIELEVKSIQIAMLSGNLQNIKKGREYQLRAIEKIKKSNEDKRILILEKDSSLDAQHSQLLALKARLKESEVQIASQSGEIEGMKKEMQMKQLELQSQITEVKYLRARLEEEKEDMSAPAGGLKMPSKRERENKCGAVTSSSKRFRKTED